VNQVDKKIGQIISGRHIYINIDGFAKSHSARSRWSIPGFTLRSAKFQNSSWRPQTVEIFDADLIVNHFPELIKSVANDFLRVCQYCRHRKKHVPVVVCFR